MRAALAALLALLPTLASAPVLAAGAGPAAASGPATASGSAAAPGPAAAPRLAPAEDRVVVRVGEHPGHGRLVFDWPAPPEYTLDQQGDEVVLRFPAGAALQLPGARRLPRNVTALAGEAGDLRIALRPGARARHFRLGNRVVVDLVDPAPAKQAAAATPTKQATSVAPVSTAATATPAASTAPPAAAAMPAASTPLAAPATPPRLAKATRAEARTPPARPAAKGGPADPPVRVEAAAAPVAPGRPAEVPAAASAAQVAAQVAAQLAAPPRLDAARPAELPPVVPSRAAKPVRLLAGPGRDRAVALPFPPGTGAAVLRRGGQILAVFDSAEPLDLGPLRADPIFGALEAELLPGATLLRLPLAPPGMLRARREANGWILEAGRPAEAPALVPESRPIALRVEGGAAPRLLLPAASPGRVVPLTDPETGMPLLLGTVREAGQPMPVGRRLPELDLPPTTLGVAVLARSDGIALQPGLDRFTITAGGGARFALDPEVAQAEAALVMTRSFQLPTGSAAELQDRLRDVQAGLGSAPPLARLPQRRAAGETLLALGMPQEAQSMLGLSFTEDPRAAADPGFAALAGAAALLAGRLPEAMALRTADLPDSDEITLWRAALAATLGEARAAGPGFAATLPLLLAYPEGLRARLLPLAAQALAEAGEGAALRRLLDAAGPGEDLALPRAILAETEGRAEEALAGYDQIAQGRDRQARARALRRAVDLRLATGRIDAAQATKALEAALFAWRGDVAEVAARLRLGALKQEVGDARGALALLRETEAMFPDQAATLQPPIRAAFLAALEQAPPLAAVALFDAYPAMLPTDQRADAVVQLLVERLLALDLGDRAAALLRQAIGRAEGASRAALGLRLAGLRLGEGDAAAALAALSETAAAELPPALLLDRTVLAARAEARRGNPAEAVATLRALGPAGTEPLSEVLVETEDWPGAAAALGAHLATALPPVPAALEDAQARLLLRQAALLALSGDEAALAALREMHAARLPSGPLAEAFAALTADPLRGLADLPRLQRELQLFRRLPERLEALRAGAPVTR